MVVQSSAVDRMLSIQLSPSQMATLDRPQTILPEPEPHSKRAQQVDRLMQHGPDFYKAADAVKVCGRLGEKWVYECGREFLRKIFRSHRRFCCEWCDSYYATKRFEEHRIYGALLDPFGTLFRVTIRSGHCSPSRDGVNDLEDASVEAVRKWLRRCSGWGYKSFTHYENNSYVIKGIIYLPPATVLPADELKIRSGACTVDSGVSVTAFEEMLSGMLKPALREGNGVLRADLMVAFQGGKHLRSAGVFVGRTSKKREEKRTARNQEKLHLISAQSGATFVQPLDLDTTDVPATTNVRGQDVSLPNVSVVSIIHTQVDRTSPGVTEVSLVAVQGSSAPPASDAGRVQPRDPADSDVPPCPQCGPGCKRVSVSREPLSELLDLPTFKGYISSGSIWSEIPVSA